MLGKGKKGKDHRNDEEKIRLTRLKNVVDRIFEDTATERQDMDRHFREFMGEWWDKDALTENESSVQANILFSTVMTLAPLLTDNRPVWHVIARHRYMQRYMNMFSLAMEYVWEALSMDSHLIQCIINALVMKVGIMKVYFDPKKDYGGEVKVENIDPRTFFIAPGYTDIWDAPFCGEKKRRSLYWIRDRFPEKGSHVKPDEADMTSSWSNREEVEMHNMFATVYEIWMRSSETEEIIEEVTSESGKKEQKRIKRKKYPHGKIIVFSNGVLLEEKPYIYQHDRPPYISLYDYVIPHQFFGMGESEQIEELNKSLNTDLQLMDKYVAMFCDPNWLIAERSGLDPQQVKRDLPKGGNVWTYNNTVTDKPITQMEMPSANRSIGDWAGMIMKVIEEITGVTDVSKGMSVKSQRQSATEISTLLESSYTRTRQRVRNLEFSIKNLCYLIISIMQQFYTDARSVPVKRDGDVEYYSVTSDRRSIQNMFVPKAPEGIEEGIDQENPEHAQYQQDVEDYQEMIEAFGDVDTIFAPFSIQIDTNSTLPMDKQSLANLALRLLEMGAIDPPAVLELLRFPNKEAIVKRMEAKIQQEAQAKQGPPPMGGPLPVMNQMKERRIS